MQDLVTKWGDVYHRVRPNAIVWSSTTWPKSGRFVRFAVREGDSLETGTLVELTRRQALRLATHLLEELEYR